MDPLLLKYAEQNAPRYTSYPTAPHFEASVDGETYKSWLSALAPKTPLSLYLHTPYCQKMCWYCGCHAFATRRDEPIADYVETILAEIDLVVAASSARRVSEIHWGGGTPNILSPDRFHAIFARLRERFYLAGLERHAVEIDPRLLTPAHARVFADTGVNRVSLGVQDFDAGVQAGIGRVQPFEVVDAAVRLLRGAGIGALSFDLMYGLPHQTPASVRRTALQAASLKPARFSVFGYAHVPWFKARQKLMAEAALPEAAARMELAETIRDALSGVGYVAIGYDHYALPTDTLAVAASAGAIERNFQGFVETRSDALIGLGPSAISTLPQGYAQNEPEVGAWRAAIAGRAFATKRGRALTAQDRVRRALIMRLLCEFAVDLDAFGGIGAFAKEVGNLGPMMRDGLAQIVGARLAILDRGRPFARLVAQAFDVYAEAPARHSRAV